MSNLSSYGYPVGELYRLLRCENVDVWSSVVRWFPERSYDTLVCIAPATKSLRPHGIARYVHNLTIYEHMRREFCKCGAHTTTTLATTSCGKELSLFSGGAGNAEAYISARNLWFNKLCPPISIRNPAD